MYGGEGERVEDVSRGPLGGGAAGLAGKRPVFRGEGHYGSTCPEEQKPSKEKERAAKHNAHGAFLN
eukprot:scaffold3064_cov95-Isochrysis_galbana.AAC.2